MELKRNLRYPYVISLFLFGIRDNKTLSVEVSSKFLPRRSFHGV